MQFRVCGEYTQQGRKSNETTENLEAEKFIGDCLAIKNRCNKNEN